MAAPLATEKVLRGTLQALQRGGLISSGADVSKLEQIPNNATDQDISDILDTIVFGGIAASTDVVRGDEDVNVFVDADNNDAPLVQQRYFRVAEDQSDPPVTDPDNELATISRRAAGPTWRAAELIVGPRTTIATSTHNGSVKLGADTSHHYGWLLGGPAAVAGGEAGLKVSSEDKVGLQSDVAIVATDEAGTNVRGGWESPTTAIKFHVGDFLATPQESFLIEQNNLGGGILTYTLRPSNDTSAAVKRIYIRGSNATNNYWSQTMVGGKAGETWGDPNNFGNATFTVVGDDTSTTANAAYIYDRKNNRASGSELFTVQANTVAGAGFFYFRILDSLGGGVFNVDSNGNVNIDTGKAYQTAGGDVAESVLADAEYPPGTVMALLDGSFTKTTDYRQINVAGVVATQPGVLLGEHRGKVNAVPLAMTGIVPVMCSTEHGDILGNGEFLVSGPDGTAVVDLDPRPGTIIGKAKGKLQSNGSGAVKGLVEVLVNLQ